MDVTENKSAWEEVKVASENLVEFVKKALHEGNVRRIIVKNEEGSTILEIPVTVGAVAAVVAPLAAALGALAAVVSGFRIVVEKTETKETTDEKKKKAS
jgi:hypothetical protein